MMRGEYQQQGLPFTDEQAGVAVQNMRTQMAKISGAVMGMRMGGSEGVLPSAKAAPVAAATPAGLGLADSSSATTATPSPASTSQDSEVQVGARFAAFPPKSGPVEIESRSDGFVVNGQPFVDPEGRIARYAFDVMTGDIGYAVVSGSSIEIKLTRAGTAAQPLQIATATQMQNGSWQVVTTSGKVMNGSSFAVLPDGLLVSRGTVAFRYTPGRGILNIPVPSGYVMAAFQHGDVGATGYVLLEKDYSNQGSNRSADLLGSLRSIGSMVGIGKKEDYALMNTSNGQLQSFNVDVEGKRGPVFKDSAPNMEHYYWRIYWLNSPSGPIAVSLEDGQRHVYITDLTTGKKVLAFDRALGVSGLTVTQASDGTVSLSARLALEHVNIPDASAFLQQHQDVRVSPADSGSAKS
ncbi:hypothetical protein CRM94_17000 [Burkholderia gladioli]|uniref:Uncharacterized protein n=2 Tax=Burkholderia gladioli TaxID=28095 RepID=A0A2A7S9Y1_BURGA|nr:hypothetical protein CRM94_17000 [Burkholderia gladioli]